MAEQTNQQPERAEQQAKLATLLDRIPPKYRTKKWLIGGGIALVVLIFVAGDSMCKAAAAPPPAPTPVATPTPTPEPTPIPRDEYQLPKQYAFVHFVNEMAACYHQHGQPATLEAVEADIMADVPMGVATLMRLYAENQCEEVEPWHQIPGRSGWMLRASGIDALIPTPESEEEEEPTQ